MAFSKRMEAPDEDPDSCLAGVISPRVLRSLVSALHFRDVATVRHSRRVAMLVVGMSRYLGWEPQQQKVLEIAALLHDVGKIGVPDNILFKPGKLSPDEAELMSLHRNIGCDVLQACKVDAEVLSIIGQSHGYLGGDDDGYRAANIGRTHQGARILSVADAYDSLNTDQVYREGKSHDEIMKVLMDSAGTQFDGNVVCALSRWIESEGSPLTDNKIELTNSSPQQGPSQPDETLEATSLANIFSYLYVLESLYDGFYLVDSDMRFVVWNSGVEQIVGQPSAKMLQQTWSNESLGYADQFDQHMSDDDCPLRRAMIDGTSATSMVRLARNDGSSIEVEMQSVPLFDDNGQLHGVAEIFRDLSRSVRRPKEFRELKMAASRDSLTSVANRGELETQLAMLVTAHSQQTSAEPFSVIFLDIDHFKYINDTFGHTAGDGVLVDVARLLQNETYSGELIGRYGGEEFVVLCPATNLEQAVARAERLRIALPRAEFVGLEDHRITASFGVTHVEAGDSVESILRRADKALYQAKDAGRNRTSSLTNDEWLSGTPADDDTPDDHSDPFTYNGTFMACVAADMIVYKLGGFVDDHNAKLLEVNAKRAIIRVGSRGLFRNWGKTDERQPIELVVAFGDEETSLPGIRRSPSRQITVLVEIRPLGKIADADIFQSRARNVMTRLRSYFVVG